MFTRNKEYVKRRLRCDVINGDEKIASMALAALELPGNDATEKATAHVASLRR
jgi:hypothetical protein